MSSDKIYDQQVVDEILEKYSEGDYSLERLCKEYETVGGTATFLQWVNSIPGVAEKFNKARRKHYQGIANQKAKPRTHPDFYITDQSGRMRFNKAAYGRYKIRRQHAKWMMDFV